MDLEAYCHGLEWFDKDDPMSRINTSSDRCERKYFPNGKVVAEDKEACKAYDWFDETIDSTFRTNGCLRVASPWTSGFISCNTDRHLCLLNNKAFDTFEAAVDKCRSLNDIGKKCSYVMKFDTKYYLRHEDDILKGENGTDAKYQKISKT